MLETTRYVRKKFEIDAVKVTGANIDEVAKWVDGEVLNDVHGDYVKVRVHRPANDRQTKAYIDDWVLAAGTGFKVYIDKAFQNSFEQISGESRFIDVDNLPKRRRKATVSAEVENDEVEKVIENGVVVPKRVPKKQKVS